MATYRAGWAEGLASTMPKAGLSLAGVMARVDRPRCKEAGATTLGQGQSCLTSQPTILTLNFTVAEAGATGKL